MNKKRQLAEIWLLNLCLSFVAAAMPAILTGCAQNSAKTLLTHTGESSAQIPLHSRGIETASHNRIREDELKKLVEAARLGMSHAYAPRSQFPVGAAVLTSKGNYYHGCNVESVISGLGTCAERSAIDHAVAHGEYNIRAIAIVSRLETPIKPCGACLQYINEFAQVGQQNIDIFMVGKEGSLEQNNIHALLPGGFGPRDLGLDLSKYRGE